MDALAAHRERGPVHRGLADRLPAAGALDGRSRRPHLAAVGAALLLVASGLFRTRDVNQAPDPRALDLRTPVRVACSLLARPRGEAGCSAEAFQTTLEDAVPLSEVEFVIVDLETTGGSPADCRITEIGAVKLRRRGAHRRVRDPREPRCADPAPDHAPHRDRRPRRAGAPPIEWVLPSFAEFARGCVFVAHNARFDFTFLNVALERLDYDALPPPPVCTLEARARVVWPDVPNVRLHTLAQYFRTAARPTHRRCPTPRPALEVLAGCSSSGGRLGIATLGDLHGAVRARGRRTSEDPACRPPAERTGRLPVPRGRDRRALRGQVDRLRSRVKSYFYGDERKKVEDLLAETVSVDGVACGSELESLVLEAWLIREHEPEVQPPGQDVAEVRVPAGRRRRGLPPDQGRPRDQGRRRVPRSVPIVPPGASGEGGARRRLPDPPLHQRCARPRGSRRAPRRDAPDASLPATGASAPSATRSSSAP